MIGEGLYVSGGQYAYAKDGEGKFKVYLGNIAKVMPQHFEE